MRLIPLPGVRRARRGAAASPPVTPWQPWQLWEPGRNPGETCESTDCQVCRPGRGSGGYPGGTAMRWVPGNWEGPRG